MVIQNKKLWGQPERMFTGTNRDTLQEGREKGREGNSAALPPKRHPGWCLKKSPRFVLTLVYSSGQLCSNYPGLQLPHGYAGCLSQLISAPQQEPER